MLAGLLRALTGGFLWRIAYGIARAAPAWLLQAAVSLAARPRALSPYPGWRFAIEEETSPGALLRMRMALWTGSRDRGGAPPVRLRWHHGLRVDTVLGNDLNRALYVGGAFEPNEFAFLEARLKPGMVFVDAGANEGLYTLFAARKVGPAGHVLAVEPSPRERQRLQANVALNHLDNVKVCGVALAERSGKAALRLAQTEHAGQNTLGAFVYHGVEEAGEVAIDLVPLDELLASEGLQRLDMMKIDVEGAELRVLRGAEHALRRFRPDLLVEVSAPALGAQGASREELFEALRGLGYRLSGFSPASGLPSPEPQHLGQADNIIAQR